MRGDEVRAARERDLQPNDDTTASDDGSFTVTNGRNGFSKTYSANGNKRRASPDPR